ncbi:MAG: hypothetical protein H5T61_07890 [Thermoflexales bacterium]|nr:hypothetical protein [Thermoflexales bacterium]
MQPQNALDDLRAIRQIMERARRSSDGFGGWFMVLWGAIWLVGFTGTHFLVRINRALSVNWLWMFLDTLGVLLSIYLGIRMGQRARTRSSSLWLPILLWWLALAAFDGVLIWKLRLYTEGLNFAFLMVLTIALGYIQFGLFTHWAISVIGLFIGLLAVVMATWLPESFNLGVAFLGGGALIGGGIGFLRQGE